MQELGSELRVLVVNSNAELEAALVHLLSNNEGTQIDAYPAQIAHCSKTEVTDWLSGKVKTHRCHIVIVDKSLIDDNEESHQALCHAVQPARCILLAGKTIGTRRAMLAFLSNMGLLACKQGLFTSHNIPPFVALSERFTWQQRVAIY